MPHPDLSSVGDHFILGLRPGPRLDARDRTLLADLRPAGVILYKSNFVQDAPYGQWRDRHAALIAEVRKAVGRDRLFVAIDHEGGRVCRTPAPVTRFSYAARWAATSRAVGDAMGRELASLGFNLNFAPVLDIDSNPANPVIGARSFGGTAEGVTAAALPFMAAMEAQGVRACGKHFPGHGDTRTDSHRELPVLDLSLAELEARELQPFRAAIGAGLGMMMTSHILFPAIDGDNPATLSRRLTHDLLRRHCGFGGVIVSDDVGMHAMDGLLDSPDAAARFLGAGHDMMMICAHFTDTERARAFAQSLVEARAAGLVDEEELTASRARIDAMLAATAQNDVAALDAADFARHRGAGALFDAETVEVI